MPETPWILIDFTRLAPIFEALAFASMGLLFMLGSGDFWRYIRKADRAS